MRNNLSAYGVRCAFTVLLCASFAWTQDVTLTGRVELVNGDKTAVPQGALSDLWWPQLDAMTITGTGKGSYDVEIPGGDSAGSYKVRFVFRQGEYVERVPQALPEKKAW